MLRPRRSGTLNVVAFEPAWWCRNPHVQTMWGPLFRRRRLASRRERLPTRDGDFVDLDWIDGRADAPLLLVLHGLEGSSRSHYVAGLLALARARGWRAVALNFRSCSGELNRVPRFYHAGDTADLDHVVRVLMERDPSVQIGAAGVSLGGNVLLKWLGEQALDAPKQIVAAATISVPFDLERCARVLDVGLRRLVYTAGFMRSFKRKLRAKARVYPGFVDLAAAMGVRTFAAYDRSVTAPLEGFADERDYWTRSSSRAYLKRVRRPTLLINAMDDPFVPPDSLPAPSELADCVTAEFVTHGGHAGFIDRRGEASWAERRAVEFLGEILTREERLTA
jgi:uncharacterized protein